MRQSGSDDGDGAFLGVRWVPEVHLGHIVQAFVTAIMLALAAAAAYYGNIGDDNKKIDVLDGRIAKVEAVLDQRIEALEASVSRIDDAEKSLASSTGTKLDNIEASLADLRVLVAGLPHDEPPPSRRD